MSDPAEDGRLTDIEEPVWVTLFYEEDDEGGGWVLSSNAADEETIAAALSHTLYRMAIGEIQWDNPDTIIQPD